MKKIIINILYIFCLQTTVWGQISIQRCYLGLNTGVEFTKSLGTLSKYDSCTLITSTTLKDDRKGKLKIHLDTVIIGNSESFLKSVLHGYLLEDLEQEKFDIDSMHERLMSSATRFRIAHRKGFEKYSLVINNLKIKSVKEGKWNGSYINDKIIIKKNKIIRFVCKDKYVPKQNTPIIEKDVLDFSIETDNYKVLFLYVDCNKVGYREAIFILKNNLPYKYHTY